MTAPTTLPPDAQAQAYLSTYQQSTQRLRGQLVAFLVALWASLGEYRDPQRRQFVAQAVPAVLGAQRQMAALTAAFLAAQQSSVTGAPFRPVSVDPARVTGAAVRNGADPVEVYGRPFHLVWRQLADLPREPGAIEQAIQSGIDRATQTALTDLQLTKTHTSRQVIGQDRYAIGWRRMLEGPHSCGLCIVASTNTYHKRDLMPMHPACDCVPVPVYVDSDIADRANRRLLGDVHQAIADRFGASDYAARMIPGAKDGKGNPVSYRDVLITHEHGELGPVLSVKGQPFAGPKGRAPAKRSRNRPAGRTPAQIQSELAALERNLPRLTTDQQRNYTQARIETLRKTLEGGA